jgi:hypothetical protein
LEASASEGVELRAAQRIKVNFADLTQDFSRLEQVRRTFAIRERVRPFAFIFSV